MSMSEENEWRFAVSDVPNEPHSLDKSSFVQERRKKIQSNLRRISGVKKQSRKHFSAECEFNAHHMQPLDRSNFERCKRCHQP